MDRLRAGQPPMPTRGAPLCTLRDTARILAGFADPRPGANDGEPGDATLAGLRVARAQAMTAPPMPRPVATESGSEISHHITDSGT